MSAAKPRRTGAGQGTRPWWTRADENAESVLSVIDPEIDVLSAGDRRELASVWQRRGGLELRVAAGFAAVANELFEGGAAQSVLEIVARAVRDEVQHAEFCVDIAARYRGDAAQWPEPAPTHIPDFAPAPPKLATTLRVLAMCCINETIACACLEAALEQAKSPLVRAALHLILTDEVEHARAGWAHLASPYVSAETRRELSRWLVRLLSAKLGDVAEETSPLPGERFPFQGILSRERTIVVVAGTLDDVIFPGLDRAGVDTADARRWADVAFPR